MKFKLFSVLLFFTSVLFAQIDDDLMDAYFDTLEQNDKYNGSVAISIDGVIVYKRAIGYANIENQIKNNEETKFKIGSISKTFTATLIMMAVEEGKIELNQSINDFFPTIKNADKITVDMLLSHRSGIYNFTSDPKYLDWNINPKTEKDLVKIISDYQSEFEPGTKFSYSNSNFVLLSYLLEKIYEKSYSEILTEKICKPFKLKNTYFGNKINIENNEANSYQYKGEWIKASETDTSIPMGAGGISSTPEDLILFGNSLFNGEIVSNESLEKMKTLRDAAGYGLFYIPFYDKQGFGHSGGIDNFSSVWAYFPDRKVSIAITTNGSDFSDNNILVAMLSIAYDKNIDLPKFRQSDTEVVPGYTGIFSSGYLGMEIEITEKDGNYFAQASGQPAFPIEKKSDTEFSFDLAGIVIEFDPNLKSFILKQGGGEFIFVKQ